MSLLLFLWACTGSDGTDDTGSDPADTPDATADTGTDTTQHTGTTEVCEPSVEVGTGSVSFEPLGDSIDMINGPQGGWHVVTSVRICDLGSEALLSFSATTAEGLSVGGSGLLNRIMLPDGPCCYTAVDVYTYLLVPGYDRPADALHGEPVTLAVEVTLPDTSVWTDSGTTVFRDSTLYTTTQ